MVFDGPEAQDHAARMSLVEGFIRRMEKLYAGDLLAIALYGSTAGGRDGPFSDIEMFCVVTTAGTDITYEWVYGRGKAEINVYGRDKAFERAGRVTDDWALSRGQFVRAVTVYGDDAVIRDLRETSNSAPGAELHGKIREMITEELYEWIGKLRNAAASGKYACVPPIACSFAKTVALILGLFHRACYTTGGSVLEESLLLPDLPRGYARLCTLVNEGRLNEPPGVIGTIEKTWKGLGAWAVANGIEPRSCQWPVR